MRHRKRLLGVLLGGLLATVLGAGVASTRISSPEELVASALPPEPEPITAPVTRQVIAESVIVRGTVEAQQTQEVVVSATESVSVVTAAPKQPGDEVGEGDALLAVNGRPVLALEGPLPAYRDLHPGASGSDVAQLQRALARRGHEMTDPPGTYGAATEQAVRDLYLTAGYEPATTGEQGAAEVAAARSAVATAEQQVADARAVLGRAKAPPPPSVRLAADEAVNAAERALDEARATGDATVDTAEAALAAATRERDAVHADPDASPEDRLAADTAVADAEAALATAKGGRDRALATAQGQLTLARAQRAETLAATDVTLEQAALAAAERTLADARAALADVEARNGAVLPQREVVWVASLPAVVSQSTAAVGRVLGAAHDTGGALLVISAGGLVVRAQVTSTQRQLVAPGMAVVADADSTELRIEGTVTSVSETATVTGDGTQGFDVVIEAAEVIDPALLGTDLRVSIAVASSSTEVLAVPLAAVSARGDGSHRVTVLEGGRARDVTVVPGLAAGGFVEVRARPPGALEPGDLVVVGH